MKARFTALLLSVAIISLQLPLQFTSASTDSFLQQSYVEYVEGEVIVKYDPEKVDLSDKGLSTQMNLFMSELGSEKIAEMPEKNLAVYQGQSTEALIERFEDDPNVEYVEPNYIYHIAYTPNDPSYSSQWALNNTGQSSGTAGADIQAEDGWDLFNALTETGSITIAVIDTGIDYNHPDIRENLWFNPEEMAYADENGIGNGDGEVTYDEVISSLELLYGPGTEIDYLFDDAEDTFNNLIDDDSNNYTDDLIGWDFYNDDNNPFDEHGHGTHVSGTILAEVNNSIGIAGINNRGNLMPLKAFAANENGSATGDNDKITEAINYINASEVKISNNSWGGGSESTSIGNAIEEGMNSDHLFIAAAGNNGDNIDAPNEGFYPADLDLSNILSVASSDRNDRLSSFSNYGTTSIDIAAPGSSILSTYPTYFSGSDYITASGTSMAAPHVAAVASMLVQYLTERDGITPGFAEVKSRIIDRAERSYWLEDYLAPDANGISGKRLNMYNALFDEFDVLVTSGGDYVNAQNQDDYAIYGSCEGFEEITATSTGSTLTESQKITSCNSNDWVINEDYSGFSEGEIEVEVTTATGSVLLNLTKDITISTPTISSPEDGDTTSSNSVSVSGTAEANSTIIIVNEETDTEYTVTANSSGNYSRGGVSLDSGTNVISVTAIDPAGNVSDSASVSIRKSSSGGGGGGSAPSTTPTPTPTQTENFPDVPSDHIFAEYINNLADAGVVGGFSDGEYKPDLGVTRAQMAKFIVEGFDFTINTSGESFSDVDVTTELGAYVQTLKNMGIVEGYGDGRYGPEDYVTRGQVTKFIMIALQHKNISIQLTPDQVFPDVPSNHTFSLYINNLSQRTTTEGEAIIQGYSDGNFYPDILLTRGQMAKIVWNSMESL